MESTVVTIETGERRIVDLTGDVRGFCAGRGDGLVSIFVPHATAGVGHGADHVLPVLVAPSITIPVFAGEPALGIWQSVVLVDTNRDNPRRSVRLSFLEG